MLPTCIIDFDSTFVSVETLDELSRIALKDYPEREKIAIEITRLTNAGMEGAMDFPTSLVNRFALFNPTKKDIDEVVVYLRNHITTSIKKNSTFFKKNHKKIYIISGGFREYIWPIVKEFGITEDHVLANTLMYDKKGAINGFDKTNMLAQVDGKVKAVTSLHLTGDICVIGDGITDYQIKEQGKADTFFAFIENIARKSVVAKADGVLKNFDELLDFYNLPH